MLKRTLTLLLLTATTSCFAVWKDVSTRKIVAFDMLTPHVGLAASAGPARLVFRIDNDKEFGIFVPTGEVTALVIRDKDVAYISVLGDGVYRSSGDWQFWQKISEAPNATFLSYVGPRLFIRVGKNLFYSSNGTSFNAASGIDTSDVIEKVVGFGDNLVAASSHSLYRSINGGGLWERVVDTLHSEGSLHIDTTAHLIFAGGKTLIVSRDNGKNWSAVPTILGSSSGKIWGTRDCTGMFYIGPDPYSGGRIGMLRSTDHGHSLQEIDNFVPQSTQNILSLVVLDRGSTIFWLDDKLALRVNRDGIDGSIKDSVASKLFIRPDTGITASACPGSKAVPFSIHIGFTECTGVRVDNVTIDGPGFATNFAPATIQAGEIAAPGTYRASKVGFDTGRVTLTFRSLTTNQTEIAHAIVIGRGISGPASLNIPTDILSYGIVDTADNSTKAFSVANAGCDALYVDSVVSSLPNVFFIGGGPFPVSVAGGKSVNFMVRFTPHEKREYVEAIGVYTSEGIRYITLLGTGTYDVSTADVEPSEQHSMLRLASNLVRHSVEVYSGFREPIEARIFDATAREVAHVVLGAEQKTDVGLAGLSAGMYYLHAGSTTLPFVIVK